MYPRRNFIRFAHKLDIYQKFTTTNDMGQEKGSWTIYKQDVPCLYVRNGSSTGIRITPTTDETDYYLIYLNHDIDIDYNTRFKNIRTKIYDEEVELDWVQIIQIDKEISFSGKIQYLQLKVKSVIE